MIDWTAIGTTVGGLLFAAYVAWSTFLQMRIARDQKNAEKQRTALLKAAEEQKQALLTAASLKREEDAKLAATLKATADKQDEVKNEKLNTIHTLVNSNMGEEKRKYAALAARFAEKTGNASDRAIAEEAERVWKEHVAKQAVVDDKPTTGFSEADQKPKEP